VQVSNLLANKSHDVATISQERTVSDALSLLKERGIGALVVTGPVPPLVGIFSERDAGVPWPPMAPRHLKPPSQNLCRPTFRPVTRPRR